MAGLPSRVKQEVSGVSKASLPSGSPISSRNCVAGGSALSSPPFTNSNLAQPREATSMRSAGIGEDPRHSAFKSAHEWVITCQFVSAITRVSDLLLAQEEE